MIPPQSHRVGRLSSTAVISGLLLCASCASKPPPKPVEHKATTQSDSYNSTQSMDAFRQVLDGYKQGVADALREIKAGRETLTTASLDQSTTRTADGLPVRPVETDAVDASTLMRIIGHNDTIRLWKGLPADPTPP